MTEAKKPEVKKEEKKAVRRIAVIRVRGECKLRKDTQATLNMLRL